MAPWAPSGNSASPSISSPATGTSASAPPATRACGARYFLFYEELDLAGRLRRHGFTVDLCPTARCEHVRAASRAAVPLQGRAHLVRSAVVYLERWHGGPAAHAYRAVARLHFWH